MSVHLGLLHELTFFLQLINLQKRATRRLHPELRDETGVRGSSKQPGAPLPTTLSAARRVRPQRAARIVATNKRVRLSVIGCREEQTAAHAYLLLTKLL